MKINKKNLERLGNKTPRANKELIVVDFSEVIYDVSQYRSLYDVFCHFPISTMIESILSISPYIDYSVHIVEVLGPWLEESADEAIEYDLFIIFFEGFMQQIDETVKQQYGDLIDDRNTIWLFDRWVDNTSAILKLEH